MNKATVRWVAVDLDADWRTYLPAKGRDRNAEYLGVVTVGLSERGAFERVKTANRGQQDTYDYYLVSAGSRRPLDATKALKALKAAGAARDRMDLYAFRPERKFIQVAESCLRGIDRLTEDAANPVEGHSLAILAGHSLECALKAFLVSQGMTEQAVRDIRHNLSQLWDDAKCRGLRVDLPTPTYIVDLNALHGEFNARYLEDLDAMSFRRDNVGVSTIRAIMSQVKDYAQVSGYAESFLKIADRRLR